MVLNVLVVDGGRHRQPTGYGKTAQSVISGLHERADINVAVLETRAEWNVEPEIKAALEKVKTVPSTDGFDVALHICTPPSFRHSNIPSLLLTYNDVDGLSSNWVEAMKPADGIIATCRASQAVYQRHFDKVFHVRQGFDVASFKRRANYRSEGPDKFSFFYVGTFSYRKGVDVLLRAFSEEFDQSEAHLHLHVPPDQLERASNGILETIAKKNKVGCYSLSSSLLSEPWLARFYNRHDCFVTLTRGEGWGMPIVEAMLCEMPVVAPLSSAMLDYLDESVGFPVATLRKSTAEISDPFGANFRKSYPDAGIFYSEPSLEAARAAMRKVREDFVEARRRGSAARDRILNNFNELQFIDDVAKVITTFCEKNTAPPVSSELEANKS